jgi:methionyl-tRNA synthetase
LHERAVTRDLTWGVPVPLDDALGKVLYVWFDAPIGYISATKEWADANGKNWEDYWKSPDTRLLHFIGKDNIVFHCIIFPAMLHAHGEYILPDNVPANEFLNIEGEKISTSRNWAVWLHEYLLDFPNRQDTLRYVLCANAPETKDNDFTWKDFQAKNNNELVAVYGNLVNRVNVLTNNYYKGNIPTPNQYEDIDNELISVLNQAPEKVTLCLEGFRFREGLQEVMNLARSANKYLTDTEPWKLQKTDPERAKTVLFLATQVLGSLAILSEPFMPFSAKVMQSALHIENVGWKEAGSEKLVKSNQIFDKLPLLFTQVSDDEIAIQTQKLEEKRKAMELINNPIKEDLIKTEETPVSNHIPLKGTITIDDFSKLDLRVGTILEAKKVEKADKLLQLTVDLGFETRTVLSGIALQFKPEDIIGKQIVLVANLAPRVMRGIESKGMILMADAANGGLVMVSPVEMAPAGSEVR